MKKFIFTTAIAILAIRLVAFNLDTPVVLTISSLGDGNCQIIAPGNSPDPYSVHCVLQSTTNFVAWTSISTNIFPHSGHGIGVTNIVQITNSMVFYRITQY
jgi:hypothetical protein